MALEANNVGRSLKMQVRDRTDPIRSDPNPCPIMGSGGGAAGRAWKRTFVMIARCFLWSGRPGGSSSSREKKKKKMNV